MIAVIRLGLGLIAFICLGFDCRYIFNVRGRLPL